MASYAHKLSPEDQKWLNNFAMEYVCADFRDTENRIHPIEYKEKKLKNGKTLILDKWKNESEHRNNRRNHCILTRENAQGTMNSLDDINYYEFIEEDDYSLEDLSDTSEDLEESSET